MAGFHDTKTPTEAKNSWQTPEEIVAYWQARMGRKFTLDVAADQYNAITKAFFSLEDNSLLQDWTAAAGPNGLAWCNPPYDNITPWIKKAAEEAEKGLTTVMLIAGTHETNYIKQAKKTAERLFFVVGGRIGYVHPITKQRKAGGRAPSFVIIFSPFASEAGATTEYIQRDTMIEQGKIYLEQAA